MPHTPGPWIASQDGVSVRSGIRRICTIQPPSSIERLDNARLIAAAPDLLAACKALGPVFSCVENLASVLSRHDPEFAATARPHLERARLIVGQAIAKAGG